MNLLRAVKRQWDILERVYRMLSAQRQCQLVTKDPVLAAEKFWTDAGKHKLPVLTRATTNETTLHLYAQVLRSRNVPEWAVSEFLEEVDRLKAVSNW